MQRSVINKYHIIIRRKIIHWNTYQDFVEIMIIIIMIIEKQPRI